MQEISSEQVCYIIVKAREFDVKVPPVIPESDLNPSKPQAGSNPTDDRMVEIINDYPDNPTHEELVAALEALNEEAITELMALLWLGRGDYTKDEWGEAMTQARERCDENVVRYLTGIPLLGDYLEEGLSELGFSCEEFEIGRL